MACTRWFNLTCTCSFLAAFSKACLTDSALWLHIAQQMSTCKAECGQGLHCTCHLLGTLCRRPPPSAHLLHAPRTKSSCPTDQSACLRVPIVHAVREDSTDDSSIQRLSLVAMLCGNALLAYLGNGCHFLIGVMHEVASPTSRDQNLRQGLFA